MQGLGSPDQGVESRALDVAQVTQLAERGEYALALRQLESEFRTAKKQADLQALRTLLPLAESISRSMTGACDRPPSGLFTR